VSERFAVAGMTCPHCQTAVSVAVAAVPGAIQVSVDLTSGTVTALACGGVPAGWEGTHALGGLAMELVAVGGGEHFGQRGVHGRGPFGWL
jgi:copper chaperone CopZ